MKKEVELGIKTTADTKGLNEVTNAAKKTTKAINEVKEAKEKNDATPENGGAVDASPAIVEETNARNESTSAKKREAETTRDTASAKKSESDVTKELTATKRSEVDATDASTNARRSDIIGRYEGVGATKKEAEEIRRLTEETERATKAENERRRSAQNAPESNVRPTNSQTPAITPSNGVINFQKGEVDAYAQEVTRLETAMRNYSDALEKARSAGDVEGVKRYQAMLKSAKSDLTALTDVSNRASSATEKNAVSTGTLNQALYRLDSEIKRATASMLAYQQAGNVAGMQQQISVIQNLSSQKRLLTANVGKLTNGLKSGKAGMAGFGMGALQATYFLDDMQYGMRGIMNNIPGLVMSLGGGAGLAAALSIATLAIGYFTGQAGPMEKKAKDAAKSIEELTKEFKELSEQTQREFNFSDNTKYWEDEKRSISEVAAEMDLLTEARKHDAKTKFALEGNEIESQRIDIRGSKTMSDQEKLVKLKELDLKELEMKARQANEERFIALSEKDNKINALTQERDLLSKELGDLEKNQDNILSDAQKKELEISIAQFKKDIKDAEGTGKFLNVVDFLARINPALVALRKAGVKTELDQSITDVRQLKSILNENINIAEEKINKSDNQLNISGYENSAQFFKDLITKQKELDDKISTVSNEVQSRQQFAFQYYDMEAVDKSNLELGQKKINEEFDKNTEEIRRSEKEKQIMEEQKILKEQLKKQEDELKEMKDGLKDKLQSNSRKATDLSKKSGSVKDPKFASLLNKLPEILADSKVDGDETRYLNFALSALTKGTISKGQAESSERAQTIELIRSMIETNKNNEQIIRSQEKSISTLNAEIERQKKESAEILRRVKGMRIK